MPTTLMLLPGLMCDAAIWTAQISALPQVHPAVPAWGLSDTLTAMANQVLTDAPTVTFALAGHSMGGRVA